MKNIFFILILTSLFSCKKEGYVFQSHHVSYTTDMSIYPYNGTKGDITNFFLREDKDVESALEWYKQTEAYKQNQPFDTCWVEYHSTADEWNK